MSIAESHDFWYNEICIGVSFYRTCTVRETVRLRDGISDSARKGMTEMDEQKTSVSTEIAIVDEQTIRNKIHVVRGMKVMLDFELAEIYGYSTKRFNEQVKNNASKFDDDFRFQITREELEELVRSKKSTSRENTVFKGQSGGTRYLPWCFTESGLYMLMTVLRGELATQQSKALIRIFRTMKDYIADTQGLASQRYTVRLKERFRETLIYPKSASKPSALHAEFHGFYALPLTGESIIRCFLVFLLSP